MKRLLNILVLLLLLTYSASAIDLGAKGALKDSSFTLEAMLKYAIEDEYLALNEYQAIVNKFGAIKPYINIIESEKTHITYLEELYKAYDIPIPSVDTSNEIFIPTSLIEAAEIGVNAEIINISMYQKFLEEDLPKDVREIFELLKKASENHLNAFKRQIR